MTFERFTFLCLIVLHCLDRYTPVFLQQRSSQSSRHRTTPDEELRDQRIYQTLLVYSPSMMG